jgi:hypothetical protein
MKECEGDEQKESELACNLLYSIASNKPKNIGIYKHKYSRENDEILVHFEYELLDSIDLLDGDHLTRLAQAIYLLGTRKGENILWRIEAQMLDIQD